jgi:UDP-3-O-[3-hydroxymyristoyl] glucosamine N-acyltransferase
MTFTAANIAKHVQGEVLGDASAPLAGFAPADTARSGDLTFAENETWFQRAEQSAASAILVPAGFSSTKKTLIRVANARVAFAKVLPLFFPERKFSPGVHPTAVVAASAQVDPTAHLGPNCVVDERAKVGPRCVIEAGTYVGPDCQLGEETHLFPNVTLYASTQVGARVRIHSSTVVGADGFGYVFDQGRHVKVPQIGNVMIGDDVEIGSNVSIDRGALGPTVIGKGTKIDNLVQIGHNVVIGEHCILCGQVGVSGSTKIGSYTTLAGQVGIAGHLKIGNQVTVAAQSGVMHDIPDGETWLGAPAQPDRQMKRVYLALQRLPELLKRVNELEKRLNEKGGSSK